jgi:hypothetical protein
MVKDIKPVYSSAIFFENLFLNGEDLERGVATG